MLIDKQSMKWAFALIAALLSACSPVRNDFAVDVSNAGGAVTAAGVSLCGGPEQALGRSGKRFAGSVPINCEGSGYVRVSFADGTTVDCPVGYVTSLETRWDFVVRGRFCKPKFPA